MGKIKAQIAVFLSKYGRMDHPEMDESIASLLMDDHFYYIDSVLQGHFIPKNISLLDEDEELIHEFLKSKQE